MPEQPLGVPEGPDLPDLPDNVTPFPLPEKVVPFPWQDAAPKRRRIFTSRPLRPLSQPAAAPAPLFARSPYRRRRPLGDILLDMGVASEPALVRAELRARECGQTLERVLVSSGTATAEDIAQAKGRQYQMGVAGDLPPDPTRNALAHRMPLPLAQEFGALPWLRIGNRTLIATTRPERIDDLAARLPAALCPSYFAVVSAPTFERRLAETHGPALARAAECRVPERLSCRRWRDRSGASVLALVLVALCLGALADPAMALRVLTALGLAVTVLNISLRLMALRALRRDAASGAGFATVRTRRAGAGPLPVISVLVPLHKEPDIAPELTARLAKLDYPRDLLDVLLVVEADDKATRDALEMADLPPWMRVIAVPDGHPKTKPRAMNYAIGFARGEIVGIYDAEDAPAPDQLQKVAARFRCAPPEVACLQGRLDYYNPTRNWMSRCFTIEYANWFRLILPGIAKLGLVVPLGGTTLFFRRAALEQVGAWDAHNVTEDADLGVRLARKGFRTEIIETTTLEEANASPRAWVKQRSRWMKGYILTWAVHTRRPRQLWDDLGPRKFWGFHALFMGSILNAILMPFLWSMVVVAFGIWHPILDWMPGEGVMPLSLLILGLTLINMAIAVAGCHAPHHRRLRPWVPTLELYFPLATLAVTKALIEIVLRPFHWDKTVHGTFGGTEEQERQEVVHHMQTPKAQGVSAE